MFIVLQYYTQTGNVSHYNHFMCFLRHLSLLDMAPIRGTAIR